MNKKIISKFLRKFGLQVSRAKVRRGSLAGVLSRLPEVRTVIDVGASDGSWSEECRNIFPDSEYILIDPLDYGVDTIRACASSSEGETTFYVHEDKVGSSTLKEVEERNQERSTLITVPTITLDSLQAAPPYLIKLDIQGGEIEAVKGAQEKLKDTLAVVMEVSLFQLYAGGYQFAEVVAFMKDKGFVVYDIFGMNYRPYDGALSQVDLVFVPENSKLRKFHGYATESQRCEQNR